MKSIGKMLETIDGLRGTCDVSEWEDQFITSCVQSAKSKGTTSQLTGKQVEIIERIHNKHFA